MGLFINQPNQYLQSFDLKDSNVDFIVEPFNTSIVIQHDKSLEVARKLIQDCEDSAFPCGGFAAAIGGRTFEFRDIDIYCVDEETYGVIRDAANRQGEIVVVRFKGNLTKVVIDDVKVDIIHKPEASCIEDFCSRFDINWSMFGLDLRTDEVIYHPLAFSNQLYVNTETDMGNSTEDSEIGMELIHMRIKKYLGRLTTKSDHDQVKAVHQALEAYMVTS